MRLAIPTIALALAAANNASGYFFPEVYKGVQAPGIVRYYLFRGAWRTQQNAGEETVPLLFRPVTENGAPGVMPGRFEGEKATVLDGDRYLAPVQEFSSSCVSIIAWVKPLAPIRGADGTDTGTGMIVQNGTGAHDGWRLYIDDWEARSVKFELGHRKGPFAVRSKHPLSVGGWNQIAVVWDGHTVQLFINGILSEEQPFIGPVTQAKETLCVGNTVANIGPLKFAIDSLSVFDGVLAKETILRELFRGTDKPAEARHGWETLANAWNAAPDVRAGAALAAMDNKSLPQFVRSMGAEWLTDAVIAGLPVSSELARRIPEKRMLDTQTQSRLNLVLADAYIREDKYDAANEVIKRLLGSPGLNTFERAEIRHHWGMALLRGGHDEDARTQFKTLSEDPNTPPQIRAFSKIVLARDPRLSDEDKTDELCRGAAQLVDGIKPHLVEEFNAYAKQYEKGKDQREFNMDDVRQKLSQLAPPAVSFFVAPGGNDDADGTFHHPFRTLERARDAIRAQKVNDRLPLGGATVYLRGGTYPVKSTLELTSIDGGSFNAPVVYTAYPGETPVLDGGFRVKRLKRIKDVDVKQRVAEAAKTKIRYWNLREHGFTGDDPQSGYGWGLAMRPICQLFEDGKPIIRSRWPNDHEIPVVKMLSQTDVMAGASAETMQRWRWASEPRATGFWNVPWGRTTLPIANMKAQEKTVRFREIPPDGIKSTAQFHFENMLEEIDEPGEWMYDRVSGSLYIWPVRNSWFPDIVVSQFGKPFIQAKGAQELVISGLTMQYGQSDGIVLENCKNSRVSGCTIRRMGGSGIAAKDMVNMHIYGNRIHTLGAGGISTSGGNRKSLTQSFIVIENNEIFDIGREAPSGNPALQISGCGVHALCNDLHDLPAEAISIAGNDHVLEYNVVERTVQSVDGRGAVEMEGDPSFRGNTLRYNLFRDIGKGTPSIGQAAIRLGNGICGTAIYGNRFERASTGNYGAVHIEGGQNNMLDSNFFLDCNYGVSFSPWGIAKWTDYIESEEISKLISQDVYMKAYPYNTKYPDASEIWIQADSNDIWRNVFIGSQKDYYRMPARTRRWANESMPSIPESGKLPRGTLLASLPPVENIGLYPSPYRAKEETK